MSTTAPSELTRRERQIMDLLFAHGKLSAGEIQERLPDPPSYSAVRATLRVLVEKGHIRHKAEGLRYVYTPAVARDQAKRSALRHLLGTFFADSPDQVVAALLDVSSSRLTREQLDRMSDMIERAKQEGK